MTGDDLYMVMEYLQGESMAGLMRRLQVRDRRLNPAITAHIIAEACAGLHAAHELQDAAGERVGLVHRDVSPQNIFITYDGAVKLLDFGIAVVQDRTVRTETGQIKGKFEYMSPEQCLAKPLNRRSDIFSLGIVLYEACTATRLFKRGNQLLTMRAILESRIQPPSEASPNVPREIDEICLRALRRRRSERFSSAGEMRRELVAAERRLAPDLVADQTLRDLMRELFDDRIAEKAELMRRLQSGSNITQIPSAEVDADVELPSVMPDEADQGITETRSAVVTPSTSGNLLEASSSFARKAFWPVLALGALASVAVYGYLARSAPGVDPKPEAASASAPSTSPASSEREQNENVVNVKLDSRPRGAQVRIAGVDRGTTPLEVELPRSSTPVELTLKKEGFDDATDTLVLDVDQKLTLPLKKKSLGATKPSPRRSAPRREPKPATSTGPKPPAAASGYHRFN